MDTSQHHWNKSWTAPFSHCWWHIVLILCRIFKALMGFPRRSLLSTNLQTSMNVRLPPQPIPKTSSENLCHRAPFSEDTNYSSLSFPLPQFSKSLFLRWYFTLEECIYHLSFYHYKCFLNQSTLWNNFDSGTILKSGTLS